MLLKNLQDGDIQITEVFKPRLAQVKLVKNGHLNPHITIIILHKIDKMQDLNLIIVEILAIRMILFGAIQQIQLRNGSFAIL